MPRLSTAGGPWFHGGVAGLDPGEELLPGARVRALGSGGSPEGSGGSPETAISVTHDLDLACSYASFKSGGGGVYEVAVEHPTIPPVEEIAAAALETNPAPPWPPAMPFHFTVRRAVVTRVVKRNVTNPMSAGRPRAKPIKRRTTDAA